MKLIKYFLQKRSVTLLLLLLIFFGGLFAYAKMGKLEDAPFTIKQALVLTLIPEPLPRKYNRRSPMSSKKQFNPWVNSII